MLTHHEDSVAHPSTPDLRESGAGTQFEGFDPPESNYWRLPNNWFDLVAGFTSWAEHKVVEYILRHTWGYQEYGVAKLITMDEFMRGRKRRDGSRLDAGCGMAENSIKKGIADAVAHGFLVVETDDSDRGRIKKFYAPRMRRPAADEGLHAHRAQGQALQTEGQFLTLNSQSLTLDQQELIPSPQPLTLSGSASDPRTEETLPERHLRQHTNRQNTPAVAVVPSSKVSRTRRGRRASAIQPLPVGSRHRNEGGLRTPDTMPSPMRGNLKQDLLVRLVAEGVDASKARSLVQSVDADRIERQLSWIDLRSYRNRVGTLISAIEDDYSEPTEHRSTARHRAAFDREKYFRGSYALCPQCGARPCIPGCTALAAAERHGRHGVP